MPEFSCQTCLIADPLCLKHLTGFGHPERPARYEAIDTALAPFKLPKISPLLAKESDLLLCHTQEYIRCVQSDIALCREKGYLDGSFSLSTGDVQICPDSFQAALLAVGGALTAVDLVMQGKATNTFSYLRPPGHHACSQKGMGFCLFNNAAIAARYAQRNYGIPRVLIADWDVHHGNGTQEIFEADPSVFYFSTHQEGIYPMTGAAEEQGSGVARGTKMNVPIPAGVGSRMAVLDAFRGPLVEAMEHFEPHLVIISAGFDAHYLDPLGGFNLTTQDFGELTRIVMAVAEKHCGGKLISLLEGGYNLQGLATSAVCHVAALTQGAKDSLRS